MNLKLKCSCGAVFTTSDELRGRMVRCPKCRKTLRVPDTAAVARERAEASANFVTEDPAEQPKEPAPDATWQSHSAKPVASEKSRGGAWRWLLLVLVLLVPAGVVGVLIILPYLRPKELVQPVAGQRRDPRELLAERYLAAVAKQDFAEANRLTVQTTHPRLAAVERVALSNQPLPGVRGKFQGLRQFHTQIEQQYTYNAERGRFEPKDELGAGLNALSQPEQAKKKAEEQLEANKADPTRQKKSIEERDLDDAIAAFGAVGDIAKSVGGMLSSQKLGPTYEDLLKTTDIPLTDAERALAQHYVRDPARWQRLLGRLFLELPDLGEFELQEVEIQGTIRTEGQSLGEPGRPIKLRLVRFTLGSIDTGWRVWLAE